MAEQNVAQGRFAPGYESILCLDDTAWSPLRPKVSLTLKPGETRILSFACLFSGQPEEVLLAAKQVREKAALEWFNATWTGYQGKLGRLAFLPTLIMPSSSNGWPEYLAFRDDFSQRHQGCGRRRGHPLVALIDPETQREFIKGAARRWFPPTTTTLFTADILALRRRGPSIIK